MKKLTIINFLLIITYSIAIPTILKAQEFPIAIGSDSTFTSSPAAFDGTNYLVCIQGDLLSKASITAQLVSPNGNLVGSRISLGSSGGIPSVAFDGTNYLMIWNDVYWNFFNHNDNGTGAVFGQFINTSGNLIGTFFKIAEGVNFRCGIPVAFNGTSYLVVYLKGDDDNAYLYGQRIDKSGNLIGSPIQISSNYSYRASAIAYDGMNYLVIWIEKPENKYIYGQFLSNSGELVGSKFLIDDGEGASDNPVSMAFDGSRYLVAFHEQAANNSGWNLFARFVSTSGSVAEDRITISDNTQNPFVPMLAFDGTNYLITWNADFWNTGASKIFGRFFNTSGIPIDTAFTIFETLAGKFPLGGVVKFTNNQFLITATRLDENYTNGDVYGKFLQPSTVGIGEKESSFILFNLYPNPATDNVTLNIENVNNELEEINIYNIIGVLVRSEKLKQNQQKINIGDLCNGIYMVVIKSKYLTENQRLIIQR